MPPLILSYRIYMEKIPREKNVYGELLKAIFKIWPINVRCNIKNYFCEALKEITMKQWYEFVTLCNIVVYFY